MDGTSTYESAHHLLLAFAGRVDDDLLGWARELVAVGEEGRAVALLAAEVAASRTPLPEPVRSALVTAGRVTRVDIDAAALPPASDGELPHRFAAAPSGVPDVVPAIRALPARQLQGATVHLTWRLTPAGTAPGPVPHPVVLVEIDPARLSGEMLAYQLAAGLERSGVRASVEVVGAGQQLPEYHDAALGAATRISIASNAEPPPVAEPITESLPTEPVERAEPKPVPLAAARQRRAAPQPAPIEVPAEPAVSDEPAEDEDPAPVLDPGERHPLADIPAAEKAAAHSVKQSKTPTRPTANSPALSALSDPLNGPLNQPLMAPLLDPTIHEHDPLGIDHLVGPSQISRATPTEPHPITEPEPQPTPVPAPAAGPPAAGWPPVVEDSWAAEWESGAWAISGDEPEDVEAERPASEELPPPPDPQGLNRPRHRIQAEPGPEPVRDAPMPPQAVPEPATPARGEPAATRLSEADRELLARLQAELVEGRKPRVSRRAGVSGPAPTGRAETNGKSASRGHNEPT